MTIREWPGRADGPGSTAAVFRILGLVACLAMGAACSRDAPPWARTAQTNTAASDAGRAEASEHSGGNVPSSRTFDAERAPPGLPPGANVILLTIDSLRADMPWNGYARPIAPRLTALESQAVSYTAAYSVSSYTSMSLGGLLAGRIPSELRRSGYFFGTYHGDVFFPKLLQRAGVHTMGVMAHLYFKSAGFDQGFDDWRLVPGITFDPNTDRDITSPQSERLAEDLLGDTANDSRRFFFWAHFLDPHDQYLPHAGIDWGKTARDRYDGEVTFTDRYFAKLLDFIATRSWAARTILIVTSDHGEEFGEHGMSRHGFEVWNTLVHVPLMIVAPGAPARRISVPRSAIDLAPTILEVYGVVPQTALEGQSLVSEIYGGASDERDVVVDLPATSDSFRRRAVVHGTQKLICFDGDGYCKLYDLSRDPLERSPVTKGPDFVAMKARYEAVVASTKEVAPYACKSECLKGHYRTKGPK